MPEYNITYHSDPEHEQILAKNESDEKVGEIKYHSQGELWIVDHTEVNPDYRGAGIARELVARVVAEASEAGVKLGAFCPYAERVLSTTGEYSDIYVAKEDQQ